MADDVAELARRFRGDLVHQRHLHGHLGTQFAEVLDEVEREGVVVVEEEDFQYEFE